MELDKKIKVKKIFDVFSDFEEVKKYYGKKVYCADFRENFSNLKLYTDRKILKTFFSQEFKPFLCSGRQHRYILPCEFVEQEKTYRPYTLEEFLNQFPMLTTITMRKNGDNDCIITCTFMGYRTRLICIDVCLGVEWISLGTLADGYEYKNTLGNWLPFGVEE